LAKASAAFNESSRDKEWIPELERLGVVPTPATPESVAYFLYSSSDKLDQAKIGEYISKGPIEKYPFIEKVRHEFAKLFNFTGLSFSESLRLFLSTFRLPGEAQCIDRLMEAFAQRLYEGHNSFNADGNAVKTMLDPPRHAVESENNSRSGLIDPPTDDTNHVLPFKSADAAFILGKIL
jgi:Sec7-like guanine-nucleotide exchange factor